MAGSDAKKSLVGQGELPEKKIKPLESSLCWFPIMQCSFVICAQIEAEIVRCCHANDAFFLLFQMKLLCNIQATERNHILVVNVCSETQMSRNTAANPVVSLHTCN